MNDLRHALRRLRSAPVVTLSAIVCLSIGIWMTCIVTAVGRGFFFPNLQVAEADRLVQLEERGLYTLDPWKSQFCCGRTTSKAVFDSLAERRVFAAMGFYSGPTSVTIIGDRAYRSAVTMSSGMMQVLRINVALGRMFIPSDDTGETVVILSHDLWRTQYGGDSAVIGRRIRLRDFKVGLTVVGVMREGFVFPRSSGRPSLYLSAAHPRITGYPVRRMLARLHDGGTLEEARAAVLPVAIRNVAADRQSLTDWWIVNRRNRLFPLPTGPVIATLDRYHNEPIDADTVRFILLIIACGLAVVLIAAANVVNLLLVRGTARRQEIAVRMALGAARMRIVRQLVMETALVAGAGAVIGYQIAYWQWRSIDKGFVFGHFLGEIDGRIAAVAVLAGLALTLIVGVWPGIRATSMSLEQVLRDGRRAAMRGSPLDGLLGRVVAVSTAATVMLLVCAVLLGLSARDAARSQSAAGRNVVVSDLTLDELQSRGQRIEVARGALARLRGLPGVELAALGQVPPYVNSQNVSVWLTGASEMRVNATSVYTVTDGFFETMSIPLLAGRGFSSREARDSSGAVVLSRTLAVKLFPNADAVGRRFRIRFEDSTSVDAIVVGVAADAGSTGDRRLYLGYGNTPGFRTSALVRYPRQADPRQAMITLTLREVSGLIASTVTPANPWAVQRGGLDRYLRVGFGLFAVLGLVLAAIGTYGVVAYSVERRTHEIGVRMALGAQRGRVAWMIIENALKVSVIGILGGLALAFAATRLLGGVMRGVNLDYPLAIGGVVALVLGVSLAASLIPGHRASRLNPADALRAE
jgi:putative ABC transport system permease protein